MIVTTLKHRMNLTNFLFAAHRLVTDPELPPHIAPALAVIMFELERHAGQAYDADSPTLQ